MCIRRYTQRASTGRKAYTYTTATRTVAIISTHTGSIRFVCYDDCAGWATRTRIACWLLLRCYICAAAKCSVYRYAWSGLVEQIRCMKRSYHYLYDDMKRRFRCIPVWCGVVCMGLWSYNIRFIPAA